MNIKTIFILPIISLSVLALIETITLYKRENITFPQRKLMLQNSCLPISNTSHTISSKTSHNTNNHNDSNTSDISNDISNNIGDSNTKNNISKDAIHKNKNQIATPSFLEQESIQAPDQKIAILDINHFITEDTKQIIRKIGVGKITSYTLTHWKNPVDVCLDALEKMGKDKDYASPITFMYKNRRMPHCIVAWQMGQCTHEEVKNTLSSYLEKIDQEGFFASAKEKDIALDILKVALDPTQLDIICKSIPPMIKIAIQLKKNGYKLYGIANITQESHEHIAKTYPEILNLFDGLALSYKIHNLKDDKKTFEHLQQTFNLNPKTCTLIDKEENTLKATSNFGIEDILSFTNHKQLRHALKKRDLL